MVLYTNADRHNAWRVCASWMAYSLVITIDACCLDTLKSDLRDLLGEKAATVS